MLIIITININSLNKKKKGSWGNCTPVFCTRSRNSATKLKSLLTLNNSKNLF